MIRLTLHIAVCAWAVLWIAGLALAAPPATATAPAADTSAPLWVDCPKTPSLDGPAQTCPRADGYHGTWYYNQKTGDEYQYKYSGGLGTYCADHIPMAYYGRKSTRPFSSMAAYPPTPTTRRNNSPC